jgi:hypothetical protein
LSYIKLCVINKKHLEGIIQYANKAAKYYQSNNRTLDQKINHIIIGKIAEYLIYQTYIDEFTKPNFNITTEPDPGWDMIHIPTKLKLDVKKQIDLKHLNLKTNELKADVYCSFVEIKYDLKIGTMDGLFEGFVSAKDLMFNLKESTNPYYRKKGYKFYVFKSNINWTFNINDIKTKELDYGNK